MSHLAWSSSRWLSVDYCRLIEARAMNYVEAPQECDSGGAALFLAGGISDAENWQSRLIGLLRGINATILNPRRASFPASDPMECRRQIEWEFRHLAKADLVAFWFPHETLCPIAMLELGVCAADKRRLIVGAHLKYARRFDLEIQLQLRRPDVEIVRSIDDLAAQITESLAMKGACREIATAG
jgi:hypothetical protein